MANEGEKAKKQIAQGYLDNSAATPLPNITAASETSAQDEERTDIVSPAEAVLESTPELDTESLTSGETTPVGTLHPKVVDHLTVHAPEAPITELHNAAQAVGGQVVHAETPVGLTVTPGEIFPPVFKTRIYANGDTAPLEQVVQRKWKLMHFGKFPSLPKLFGGQKVQQKAA